jgi:SAM-dependent methyltransferase
MFAVQTTRTRTGSMGADYGGGSSAPLYPPFVPTDSPDRLIYRGDDPHRPSLENRVAYQWESGLDTLGYRDRKLRDETLLKWALEGVAEARREAHVLDIGASYGNLLFMLNAMLDHDPRVKFTGIDIDERTLEFARTFAKTVHGFGNCEFLLHDVTIPLPFPNDSLDVVIAADVLEHLHDMPTTLREIARVLQPSGRLLISTPLADSVFKRLAMRANAVSRGRLHRSYYRGKGTEVDEYGQPIMKVHAGHDHVSEMTYEDLIDTVASCGYTVGRQVLSPIMSGSRWFDAHPLLLSAIIAAEALQTRLKRPSWSHGICLDLRL